MRPDAAAFSPRLQSKTDDAAPVSEDDVQAPVEQPKPSKPDAVELEKACHALLDELAALRIRCNDLEITHAELKKEVEQLREAGVVGDLPPSSNNMALVPYASSESAEDEEAAPTIDLGPLKDLKDQMDIVLKVLQNHKEHLDRQDALHATCEKRFEHRSHDQTAVKGRVGALEKSLKALRDDFEALSLGARTDGVSKEAADEEEDASLNARMLKLKLRLADHETKCRGLYEKLSHKCDGLTAAPKTGQATTISPEQPPNPDKETMNRQESRLAELSKSLTKIEGKLRNKEIVDEAATKDALYAMFHDLSSIMEAGGEGVTYRKGPFQVSADEAFFLRDRVICRLAMFDGWARALKEARASEKWEW